MHVLFLKWLLYTFLLFYKLATTLNIIKDNIIVQNKKKTSSDEWSDALEQWFRLQDIIIGSNIYLFKSINQTIYHTNKSSNNNNNNNNDKNNNNKKIK